MPLQSYSLLGNRPTGNTRIRNRALLGAVVEEQMEHSDGSVTWRKAYSPLAITFGEDNSKEKIKRAR